MRGLFVTIEGPEGAGKSTQANLLKERLQPLGPLLHTREPGGTPIGERIRSILLDEAGREMAAQTEMLLFAAARAQFVREVVEPALAAGHLVLSERYVDASLAYQGHARGLGIDVVRKVNAVATGGLMPDLTILLDIDPEVGLARARHAAGKDGRRGHGDRLEQEEVAFHIRVREGFRLLAREEATRFRIVDGSRDPRTVHEEILDAVERFLRARGWPLSNSS